MAIRNSIVAYAGIEQARKDGYSEVMSGDGCDELFAGYNFLAKYYTDVGKLNAEMERLWRIMHFSSFDLAQALSARIKAPFLDSEFAADAKTIPITAKIGIHEQRQWGKYILRTCFEANLGRIIAWREKAAQELGAGIQGISAILDESVKDSTFQQIAEQAAAEKVLVRNKEHAQYYLFYRKYYAPPIEQEEQLLSEKECSNRCPQCMGCFKSEGRFCRICGAYPVIPIPMSSSSSSPK
jgi:asparagine synthase (glutamine-hydrolysing)